MCTGMNVKTEYGDIFFGRTMDFSHELDPQMYVVSRGYEWSNILNTHTIVTQYAFMGIGQDISPVTFADGVNEKGFAVATLYFPGFAKYDDIDLQKQDVPSLAAIELVKFLLSTCGSVKEATAILQTIKIVGIEDAVTQSVAPLHWIMADRSGDCMVIEKMANGLHLIPNTIGVLSNSPNFQWHEMNLRNYMNVMPYQKEDMIWDQTYLKPFGQGAGTFGLPGDYTPPSRFVRFAYQKTHTLYSQNKDESVMACFHVMESVSIPKGVVVTQRETNDYTQYTCFIDLHTNEYYFRTYNNHQIIKVQLPLYQNTECMKSLGQLKKNIVFNHI